MKRIAKGAAAIAITAFSLTTMPNLASSQELPTAPYLPLEMAVKAASAALEQCTFDGYKVSVAIVARSGETKVLLKADGSGPHTVGSSQGKAFTSASMGRATLGFSGFLAKRPDLNGLRDMDPRLVILGGGLPIKFNGVIVGGIGVGGAPGADKDEKCAKAGLTAIGAD